MPLKYDYDIHWIGQPETTAWPPQIRPRYHARFRDLATVEALRQADPKVRSLFEASGFGLSRSNSNLPDGTFAAGDSEARADVAERLAVNLAGVVFDETNANGLCLRDFIAYEIAAKPFKPDTGPSPRKRISAAATWARIRRTRPRFPTVNPLALAILAILVLVLPRLFPEILQV